MKKLISIILYAEKGFLKKPDINDGIYLTYNLLHKPALLGILGAIIGLPGYQKNGELPVYYNQLHSIPVGVEPVNSEKGGFQKTIISYNNTTGLASNEPGGNLIITEQTLIAPAYRVFLLLDTNNEHQQTLLNNLQKQEAVYLPYLGKNDYSLWWDKNEVIEYEYEKVNKTAEPFTVTTAFNKGTDTINSLIHDDIDELDMLDFTNTNIVDSFMSFEYLPIGFNEQLMQYTYANFAFTNYKLKAGTTINNMYCLNHSSYVQLN